MHVRVPNRLSPDAAVQYGQKILPGIKETVSKRMFGVPVYMAAGDFCPDIESVSAGYLEAWETVDIGKKLYSSDFALTHAEMAPYYLVKRFLTTANTPRL